MELKDLAKYENIVIQCHDNPDADAIGSGFALQSFLRSRGSDASLVYGGAAAIQKPSLLLMLSELDIHIDHIEEVPQDTQLLITVDCQRGAGNVKLLELPDNADFAVIDHHSPEIPESEYTIIRPYLASCATLVWDLLNKESYDMDARVVNALYYGLFMDTNGMSELRHPLDRDLAEISVNIGLIRMLRNSAITSDELDIVAKALSNRKIIGNIGLFCAEPCDANLLGFASDIAQQVVHMDCCIVYCLQPQGIKLSVRSSTREIMASEIAEFICRGVGSGGGSVEKAGGFMSYARIEEVAAGKSIESFTEERLIEYATYYDLIYADNNDEDFAAMPMYRKLPLQVAFAKSVDVYPSGTRITIRTLEGDVDTVTGEDIYLMIGIEGEVYPIAKSRFETDYLVLDAPCPMEYEYIPAIINRNTGARCEISPYAQACIPTDEKLVRARMLTKATKVFTQWDLEKYFTGKVGDWLVANEDSHGDCYIVRSDIFVKTYDMV